MEELVAGYTPRMKNFGVRFVTLMVLLCAPALVGCDAAKDAAEKAATKATEEEAGVDSASGTKTDDDAKPASLAKQSGGAKTPQAAFEILKKSANGRDYKTLFNILTVESQDQMLIGALIGSGLALVPVGTKPRAGKKKELDAIFAKHGVKNGGKPKGGLAGMANPEKMMKDMAKDLAGIKDRAGLFNDLILFLEKSALSQRRLEVVSLTGLKVKGDRATGTLVLKGKTVPAEFRRVDGLWYVHLKKWPG